NPNDLCRVRYRPANAEALADGILAGQESPNKCLVHQHDAGRTNLVAIVEVPAGENARAHGAEVSGADDQEPGIGRGRRVGFLGSVSGSKTRSRLASRQGKKMCGAGGLPSGNAADFAQDALHVAGALERFAVPRRRGEETHGYHMLRVEPGIDREKALKAA